MSLPGRAVRHRAAPGEIAEDEDFIPLVAAEAVDDFADLRRFRQMSAAERRAERRRAVSSWSSRIQP
ncbi:MAG: hypothetical protein U0521_22245 [Anaerolineae bacterium]